VRRVNPAAEGKVYPEVHFVIDADRAHGFASLFGDPARIPPTMVTAAEFSVIPTIVGDPDLDLDFARVVHGSQEYEYVRPLEMGEHLTVRSRLASIRQRAATGFLTIETELLGEDGMVAVLARSVLIERASS
jgi:acyl dehydratase